MDLHFRATMDPHSVDVLRGEDLIAMLQWHPYSRPHVVVWMKDLGCFTLEEMRAMTDELTRRAKTGGAS